MKRRFLPWITGSAIGIVLFAVLLGGAAFAQSEASESATSLGQTFMERLAGNLGLSTEELQSTITDTGNEVIDEAVASGQLTEAQGDRMRERLESGPGFFNFGGRHGFGGGMMGHFADLDTLAEILGTTPEDLRADIEAGSTLTEIIEQSGSTVDEVVTALVERASVELDEAVANGRITQEPADDVLANLPDRLTEMIESGRLDCLPGRSFGGPMEDSTQSTD